MNNNDIFMSRRPTCIILSTNMADENNLSDLFTGDTDGSDNSASFSGFGPEDVVDDEMVNLEGDIGDSDIDFNNSESDEESDISESESEGDLDIDNVPAWNDNLTDVFVRPFTRRSGPLNNLDETATKVDYFNLYFPTTLLEKVVEETNRFAGQQQLARTDHLWKETTFVEMRAFIGMLIYMGITQASDVSMYWSSNKCLGNKGFQEIMPLKRFNKLSQYLHINNNLTDVAEDDPNRDRLHKVRPLLDITKEKFLQQYRPRQNQSIDEAMIPYKGRFVAKQYMPSKPTKWGIKVWMRCDSQTGFCHQYEIYMGKTAQQRGEKGLPQKVVERLTMSLRGHNHHIFFDSFFTSVSLLRTLLQHRIYACGTIVKNRKGFPLEFRNFPRMQQGQYVAKQDGNLVATLWQDNRLVTTLSSNASAIETDEASRRQKDGTVRQIQRPLSVALYQQNFRGVDVCDQLLSAYPVGRPSKKWWKYIFHFLLNVCITNAYITMVESNNPVPGKKKRYKQLDFRVRLADELISGYSRRPAKRNPIPVNIVNVEEHSLIRMTRKRSYCKSCVAGPLKRRKDTVYGCSTCLVHLCSQACLVNYHHHEE